MWNLVVTSDFPSTAPPAIVAKLQHVAARPRIAWIPPSSSAASEHFSRAKETFAAHGFDRVVLLDIEVYARNRIAIDLGDKEIVYLSGGDPGVFLRSSLQADLATHLHRHLDDGKMLVAASGGAMILTPNVSLFRLTKLSVDQVLSERGEHEGLGLLPFEVLPHHDRFDEGFLAKVREYSRNVRGEIVALDDGSAVIRTGAASDSSFVGTAYMYRDGIRLTQP